MPDALLARDAMSSTPIATLHEADGWLVCLRAGDSYDVRYYDEFAEAIETYDDGWRGWYATALCACRRGVPIAHLTHADICSLRRCA